MYTQICHHIQQFLRLRMMAASLVAAAVAISLLLTCQLLGCAAADHHVRVVPDQSAECEDSQQCLTFSEALLRADDVFMSNTSVVFSAGEYSINSISHNLTIAGVSSFSLTGPHSTTDQVHINCHTRFRFDFVDSSDITIANIVFSGCGSWSEITSGALIFTTVSSLTVANVTVQHSHGYGLMGIHIEGNVTIHNCIFFNNSRREGYSGKYKMGGNCVLHVVGITESAHVRISGSQFISGIAEEVLEYTTLTLDQNVHTKSGGGGLAVYLVRNVRKPFVNDIVTIVNSVFYNNSAQYGGNVMLSMESYLHLTTLVINNSTFQNGSAYIKGGGLHTHTTLTVQFHSPVWVDVSESCFINNTAQAGGGLSFTMTGDTEKLNITLSGLLVIENQAERGGGIYIETDFPSLPQIYIEYSKIWLNYARSGGGLCLFINLWKVYMKVNQLVQISAVETATFAFISSTSFTGNKGHLGSALHIEEYVFDTEICTHTTYASIWLKNVNITANTILQNTMYYSAAAVRVSLVLWVVLEDTTFHNNTGGGIYANNSNIIIIGDVNFEGNHGYSGGAIQLDCICDYNTHQLFLYFMNSSHTSIAHNQALQYGGGIGISERCYNPNMCFYQMFNRSTSYIHYQHATVEMRDNHATIAGDDIYGASKIQCHSLTGNLQGEGMFNSVFIVQNISLSSISSIPYHVCFCKQKSPKSHCLNSTEKRVFPGQEFTVSAATVGNHRGASPAAVQSQFIGLGMPAELGTRQSVQKLGRTCGDLTYSIRTTQPTVQLHLTVQGVTQAVSSEELPAIVNVTILPCPLGFTEVGDPPQCGCMPHLSLAGVLCDIDTQTHQCPTGMWIGNFSGDIVTHPHCPFDYCRPGQPNVSLKSQHDQCQYSRRGVLCGVCQHGLSLSLGSSQCQKCSSVYPLLFLPFALAGVALVFLLLKCNLTVSTGNINGPIFYANIIRVNSAIFFPRERGGVLVSFFSTFIAWLNLDFGIQVCFFDGLSAFGRAWLQFLFPAYIWILIGTMTLGSRYSMRMARVTGNNAVPVLATLFLLSYAKLLRTVIDAASFTTITGAGGGVTALWLVDGNLLFLNVPHIFLFLMSLIAAFAYIIPFTVLVLLAPCLQARSNHRLLHWTNRIKPLLDAYQGPYKDRFRFWTGLMLVIRAILFITFASNALGDPRVNLLAIAISLLLLFIILWNTGPVYKSYLTHSIKCFYILNLGVYSAATQFLTSSGASPHQQGQLAAVMVGSAFLVFCGILLYHLHTQLQNMDTVKTCYSNTIKWLYPWSKKTDVEMAEVEMAELEVEDMAPSASKPTVSVVEFNKLREPLLTEN